MKHLKKKEEKIFVKTYESFIGDLLGKNKYQDYENISKPKDGIGGEVDIATKSKILNVDNFNKWLSEEENAPHMVGKINKLSPATIEDYFFYQGVQCSDEEIFDFMDLIERHWNLSHFKVKK